MSEISKKRMHIILGVFALLVVILRFAFSWDSTTPSIYYFTVQSNLLVALYWLWVGLSDSWKCSRIKASAAGAVATYITITGVVYTALLHGIYMDLIDGKLEDGLTPLWQYSIEVILSYLLHVVIPILMLVDYTFFTPGQGGLKPYWWLLYPFIYGIGHTLYGMASGKYLYPFIDPTKAGGWWGVLRNAVLMYLLFLLVAYGLYGLNSFINRRMGRSEHERAA